jgi:hypothetical protein
MNTTCPECGAASIDGLSCWETLGLLIAWEYQDAELRREHFLIVASYNLQHPAQFTDEALARLRESYIEHLDHGLPAAAIRERTGRVSAGATRVLKPEAERQPVLRRWPMTIADVYTPDQPQGAAARVRAWAQTIRRELAINL